MNIITIQSEALLGEGPRWRADVKTFYWTDILAGKIFAYNPATNENRLIFHCAYETGAFLFNQHYDLLLFTQKGLLLSRWSKGGYTEPICLFEMNLPQDERFNDATCDARGRIFAGTLRESHAGGNLYVFSRKKSPDILLSDLKISNGMGFSPDNKIFYHTDSGDRKITAYQYDIDAGTIHEPHTLYTAEKENAVPDGMAVDAKGDIWTALWGGSCVQKISSQGKILCEYQFPALQVSSLCFGGNELTHLFVTSASIGESELESGEKSQYRGGNCYFCKNVGMGAPDFLAGSNFFTES